MSSEVSESETNDDRQLREQLVHALPRPALADAEALFAATRAVVHADRGLGAGVRALSTLVRVATGIAVAAALAGATFLFRSRPDWTSGVHPTFPVVRAELALALLFAAVAVATVVALRPLQRRSLAAAPSRLLDAGALLVALGLALFPIGASSPADTATVIAGSAGCLAIGTGVAALMFLVLRALDRGASQTRLAAAAAAGLTANAVLLLHCPSGDPRHTVPGHFGASVLLLLAVLALSLLPSRRR